MDWCSTRALVRIHFYDPEDIDEAMAELDRLNAEVGDAEDEPGVRQPLFPSGQPAR